MTRLWSRVRVKVLGSVNSNHNPKHIYNPNPKKKKNVYYGKINVHYLYTILIQSIDMIGLATETPIKTCNMSLAWEPPYNDIIIHINKIYIHVHIQ